MTTIHMTNWNALKIALTGPRLVRAILVGLIVGSILNLINQGEAIFGEEELRFYQLALTYSVPFCVVTYGAWSTIRKENIS